MNMEATLPEPESSETELYRNMVFNGNSPLTIDSSTQSITSHFWAQFR